MFEAIRTVTGDGADDTISFTTDGLINHVNGGAGNDTITTGVAADVISGQAGNDAITSGDGADIVHGGDGDDTLRGGAGRMRCSAAPAPICSTAGPASTR